jgi:UPF0042 nucleotide-binding protein
VTMTSFGFKYGQLSPLDSLFDVRFLRNPFFDPKLRHKTGLSEEVAKFILEDGISSLFLDKVFSLLEFLLPHYYNEGKHYLRVGIGCTGGMHRSVFVAESIAKRVLYKDFPNTVVAVVHRDLRPELIRQEEKPA